MKDGKQNFSQADCDLIVDRLKKFTPGAVPLPLFLEVARLFVTATIEIVPVREREGEVEVLLMKRPDNDPNWPSLYHAPGTILRATDKIDCFEDAFKRLIYDELNIEYYDKNPVFVKPVFRFLGRGKELTLLYWIEVKGNKYNGDFFSIEALPENIIKEQIKYIEIVVQIYKNTKGI